MEQTQAVDMPYQGESVETFTLTIDDVHNILAALLTGVETISENLALVSMAKLIGVPLTEENGFPEDMEMADGQKAFDTFTKSLRNVKAIHDAMESGKNVQVIAVPF